MATIAERLAEFQAKRQQLLEKKQAIVNKAVVEEGRTLDEKETEENAQLEADIKSVDETIAVLKSHEAIAVAQAAAVQTNAGQTGGGTVQVPGNVISVQRNLPILRSQVWPKEWAQGRKERLRSSPPIGRSWCTALMFEAMLPCERMTPLGLPVVPEV